MKLIKHNYLPEQYENTNTLPINHNYLKEQFKDTDEIFSEINDEGTEELK